MANTKSAKKQVKKNITKARKNLSRRTSIKTAIKKVLTSLEEGIENIDVTHLKELLRDAESKLAHAKTKGLIHAKTAARKVSRLAKKVSAVSK